YPRFEKEFVLTDLPEAVVAELRRVARANYENAIEAGREVVLRHLQQAAPSGEETPECWQAIKGWLADPEDLAAWRVLARVLARLQDAEAPDPVTALAAFLNKNRFELDIKQLTLEIPDDLKVRPAGR